MGLLTLAAQQLERERLLAVTVDHGLRSQSAQEARDVGAYCTTLGVRHHIATWTGEKPRSGVIAAAREARYGLLADVAEAEGADVVLVAHTADDQAETVAMRAQRRNEGAGLAGMAPATLFDRRIWLLRPLLDYRREAIRDYLREQGVAWVDDPTNEDHAYERVRTRFALTETERSGLVADAKLHAETRFQMSRTAAALLDRFVVQPTPGLVRVDPALCDAEREPAIFAMRAMLATIGGTSCLPDEERVAMLISSLAPGARATLSRVVVDVRRSGIWLRREERDLPLLTRPERRLVWDGRWAVDGTVREGVAIGPLGREGAHEVKVEGGGAPESLVRAALTAEPALVSTGNRRLPAGHGGVRLVRRVSPYARFLSCFDIDLANALARLIGAPALLDPPWKQHNAPGP